MAGRTATGGVGTQLFSALVVGCVAAAGCGSGTSVPRSAPSAFATQWPQLAASYQREIQSLQSSGRNALAAGGRSDVLAIAGGLRDLTAKTLTQLQHMSPPSPLRKPYDRAVNDLKTQQSALREALSSDAKNDSPGVQKALSRFIAALGDWMQVAQQLNVAITKGAHS